MKAVLAMALALACAAAVSGATDDTCPLARGERKVLESVFRALGGTEWRVRRGWLTESEPCGTPRGVDDNWYGVICGPCEDDVRHVEYLMLEWNNLSGNLTDALGELRELRVLNVGTNNVGGEIPAALGNCQHLQVLKLSYNRMGGKIPPSVYALRNLEEVDLTYNDFVGDVNPLLLNSPKMRRLVLRGNRGLSGDLNKARDAIAQMKGLETLDLHWNHIGGELPAALFRLERLEQIFISKNDVSGRIPDDVHMPKLTQLWLQDNYIEGTLPPGLFRGAPNLEELDLERNFVSGPIPAEVAQLSKLRVLRLHNNLLSGPLPAALFSLRSVEKLDVSNNEFGGALPEDLSGLENVQELNLQASRLTGTIPTSIGSLLRLRDLNLANNKLSGALPESLGQLRDLRRLYLRRNRLSGAVPSSVAGLRSLESLELQSNRLETLPEALGQLENLTELLLHENAFAQPAPAFLGRLKNLAILTLHHNRFTGDRIPDEFGELRALREFTLHDNLIKGNPYPRVDPGIDDRPPHDSLPFCEDLRDYESGKLVKQYFRTCGTRNDFYVDVLLQEKREQWVETHGDMWHACYGKCKPTQHYHKHLDFQRTSRFAEMREVSDKGRFATMVRRMQHMYGDEYRMHPPTFRLPYELEEYKEEYKRDPSGYWLLKPTISCCGQNIRLVTGPDDPSFPLDLGNWILQRFVHPPMLVNNHKYVLRLFVMVTSFSPLRIYLHPDGDVFYTHAEYRVKLDDINKLNKRGYFITDYFFSTKQRELFTSSTHLFDYLKSTGVDTDLIYRNVRDAIVKALLVSETVYRHQQNEHITHPQSVYEVVGYDILIDANSKAWVCEVNTTPNMGLEINRASDPVIHEEDFELKLRIMRNFLQIVGVVDLPDGHPNQANARTEACEGIVDRKLAELGRRINESAYCPDSELDFVCLSEDDVAILKSYECEYQRRDELEPMFPGEEADKYLRLLPKPRREQHLVVWWDRLAHTAPDPKAPTPWARHYERPWRNMPANYNWARHSWTQNVPGNRWNTEEDGTMPDPEKKFVSILNDEDAFADDNAATGAASAAPAHSLPVAGSDYLEHMPPVDDDGMYAGDLGEVDPAILEEARKYMIEQGLDVAPPEGDGGYVDSGEDESEEDEGEEEEDDEDGASRRSKKSKKSKEAQSQEKKNKKKKKKTATKAKKASPSLKKKKGGKTTKQKKSKSAKEEPQPKPTPATSETKRRKSKRARGPGHDEL